MTRGGYRKNAGRPKGTTKEPTVSYQRKIKPEWIPLMDDFLNEIKEKAKKGLLIALFCLFTLALPTFALTLEGGVSYTEETARVEAFEGVAKFLTFPNTDSFYRSLYVSQINYDNVLKVLNYKASYFGKPYKITGIVYKDEPNKMYGYIKKHKGYECFCVQVTEGKEYPQKIRNYYAKTGELMSVGLVTETQEFKYDAEGKLHGYWENGKLQTKTDKGVKMQLLSVLDYGS